MPEAAPPPPVRAGAAAVAALAAAATAMFAIPYSTQAILPEIGADLDAGPAATGLTITVVVAGIAVGAWVMGPLSDRVGRRRVMAASCALLALPTALITLAPDLATLLVLRAAQGLLLPGLLTVATAYAYEAFAAARVPTVVGLYTAALILGGFLGRTGPALLVDDLGWRSSLAVLAAPALAAALLLRLVLPDAPPPARSSSPLTAVRAHLRNVPLLLNALAAGCTFIAFVGVFSIVAYRLESPVFGLSPEQVGLVYVVWLVGALTPVAVRAAGRRGPRRLLPVFPVIGAVGLALASATWLPLVVVGLGVLAGGLFAMVGVAQLLVPQLAERDRGSAMSLHLTIYYLLGSLGPFALGLAWDAAGWAGTASLAFAAIGVAFALTLLLRRAETAPGADEAASGPVLS
jgi:YNFM family putative membrane transporter